MLKTVYESLLTLVYPRECRICGNSVENSADGVACAECWDKVRIFDGTEVLCEKCGAYLGKAGEKTGVLCRECDHHYYDQAFAGGIYEQALAATILQLKTDPHLCRRTKEILRAAYDRASDRRPTFIIPVPISRKRFHERGFNQAELLAECLSKQFRIRMANKILIRKSHTPMHRAAMDRKAREVTVKNAFDVVDGSELNGSHVLLVDDVFTSGSTLSACAAILKKNGASRVDVLTLARAVEFRSAKI